MKHTGRICTLFLSLGVVAGAVFSSTGCGDQKTADYAFVTNGVAPFWTIAQAGANAAAKDLKVEVEVLMPAGGSTEQKTMIEDLISRGIKGISVSPIDADNQTDFLNEAADKTILITQDSDAPKSKRRVYIGMDNYSAGRMCGKLVKEAVPDGGEIMILVGRMEQDNAKHRRQGLIDELLDRSEDRNRVDPPGDVIKGDKFTILGTMTDQFDRSKAKANAEDALSRHPTIAAMVGLFEDNSSLILQALEQGKALGRVKVIAFDEAAETLQGIIDGTVHGTIVQNPYMYGYKSIEVLKKLNEGDETIIPENKFIDIPAQVIRKDNVKEFWDDLKKKLGK